MKKIALTALALAVSAGTALAADLPSRKAPVLPPPPPPPMWTGFYAGLNAGGTWTNNNAVNISTYNINPAFVGVSNANVFWLSQNGVLNSNANGGFIGGGQIGYNWQISGFGNNNIVTGIEADIQGIAASNGRRVLNSIWPGPYTGVNGSADSVWNNVNASSSLQYIGTVRGRIGYLVNPTFLVYGTGGLAYGGVSFNATSSQLWSISVNNVNPPTAGPITLAIGNAAYANTQVGWTAGGGLEWMFMPNWSLKAEYLYYDLGNVSTNSVAVAYAVQGGPSIPWTASTVSAHINGNIVRAGVNYHFNFGAAPVVAKY